MATLTSGSVAYMEKISSLPAATLAAMLSERPLIPLTSRGLMRSTDVLYTIHCGRACWLFYAATPLRGYHRWSWQSCFTACFWHWIIYIQSAILSILVCTTFLFFILLLTRSVRHQGRQCHDWYQGRFGLYRSWRKTAPAAYSDETYSIDIWNVGCMV